MHAFNDKQQLTWINVYINKQQLRWIKVYMTKGST